MKFEDVKRIRENPTAEDCDNKELSRLIDIALEKQIPKKVAPFKRTAHDFQNGVCKYSHYPCEHIQPFNHEYQYTDYSCPICGKRVSDGQPNNCCHCGQALDWSKNNE